MPPKRKGGSKQKGVITKKAKNVEPKTKKSAEKTSSDKTDEENWTLSHSWGLGKITAIGPSCMSSKHEILIVGSEETYGKRIWKVYAFDINGELLREWKLNSDFTGHPHCILEVCMEGQRYLLVTYGFTKIIEFREIESGELKKEVISSEIKLGNVVQVSESTVLVENTTEGASKNKERLALLDIGLSKLKVKEKFEPRGLDLSGFCCLPDPDSPDDLTDHLTIVCDKTRQQLVCYDKLCSAIYWKVTKLPDETSSFGTKFCPTKVFPMGSDRVLVLQQGWYRTVIKIDTTTVDIYDVYGNHKKCIDMGKPLRKRIQDVHYFRNGNMQSIVAVQDDCKLNSDGTTVLIFTSVQG